MTIELNHTIVRVKEKWASAKFLTTILGIEVAEPWGPFARVRLGNQVELDFMDARNVQPQHYAFLVSDAEFDAALARLQASGIPIYAEPDGSGAGEINHHYGGRGVYFQDPDGHGLELITKPYGPTPEG
jgi:catechol 2,3-dioxygenase-like lactoylglutathione lyase family enzyme